MKNLRFKTERCEKNEARGNITYLKVTAKTDERGIYDFVCQRFSDKTFAIVLWTISFISGFVSLIGGIVVVSSGHFQLTALWVFTIIFLLTSITGMFLHKTYNVEKELEKTKRSLVKELKRREHIDNLIKSHATQ